MTRTLVATLTAALLFAGCSILIDPTEFEPMTSCPAGQKICGYKCVADNDPSLGCGNPGCSPCPTVGVNAAPACSADGTCGFACVPGWGDCDGTTTIGCEASVQGAPYCGVCGRSCTAPSTCDNLGFVCTPDVEAYAEGVATGLEFHAAEQVPYALVQTGSGGILGKILAGGTFSTVATGLGYVSGLAIYGDAAWFGRSVGQSELGYFSNLTPSPAALQTYDLVAALGPVVDLAYAAQGAVWIPQAGSPVRYLPSSPPIGVEVLFGANFTALATERTSNRYYAAGDLGGGTIWESFDPANPASWSPIVTGAGTVGSMAVVYSSGNHTLYWTDISRGDVNRYLSMDGREERIFAGSGWAEAMDIAVDAVGDPWWTNRATGEVMTWKSYGGFPKAVHVIGRSTAPGKIVLAPAPTARVYWADEVDWFIRAVRP